jgi:hypothetical protein
MRARPHPELAEFYSKFLNMTLTKKKTVKMEEMKKEDFSTSMIDCRKQNWFCDNAETIREGLAVMREFFRNPIVKGIITLLIGGVSVAEQVFCKEQGRK